MKDLTAADYQALIDFIDGALNGDDAASGAINIDEGRRLITLLQPHAQNEHLLTIGAVGLWIALRWIPEHAAWQARISPRYRGTYVGGQLRFDPRALAAIGSGVTPAEAARSLIRGLEGAHLSPKGVENFLAAVPDDLAAIK